MKVHNYVEGWIPQYKKIGGRMCASTYWNKNRIKQKSAESNAQYKLVKNEIKQRVIKHKHKEIYSGSGNSLRPPPWGLYPRIFNPLNLLSPEAL